MTYETLQTALTHAAIAVEIFTVLYLAVAFVLFTWQKTQAEKAVDIESEVDLPSLPEQFQKTESLTETVDQALVQIPVTNQPKTPAVPAVSQTSTRQLSRCEQLRKQCTQQGITWRNANGNGKHLSTQQMQQYLGTAAIA